MADPTKNIESRDVWYIERTERVYFDGYVAMAAYIDSKGTVAEKEALAKPYGRGFVERRNSSFDGEDVVIAGRTTVGFLEDELYLDDGDIIEGSL